MKIVTVFLAYVASLNFANVGAMDQEGRVLRSRRVPLERGDTSSPNPSLDMAAWTNHDHTHGTAIQHLVRGHAKSEIMITKVMNGEAVKWHVLVGELLPNPNITACNGPFGYAIVEVNDTEPLYACLHPPRNRHRFDNREHTDGVPEFLVCVVRDGMTPRSLTGVLTTADARITVPSFVERHSTPNTQRQGHVRYIRSNPTYPINTAGDIYTLVN